MTAGETRAPTGAVATVKARRDAKVLVVGVGGLGCPAAIALAAAGIGTLGLADDDPVELSNLHRQILYGEADVGVPKLEAAARALPQWTRRIQTIVHPTRLLPDNALELVAGYDLVVEGSDNFATKFLTADACVIAGVPVVQAAAIRWHGTAFAIGPQGRPCYRCVFEDVPREAAPNCADAGVVGPVVGIVAALQADLALGVLDGRPVAGTLVTFDGQRGEVRRRAIAPRPGCALCGSKPTIVAIAASRYTDDSTAC